MNVFQSWLLSLFGGSGSVKPVGTLMLGFQALVDVSRWKLPHIKMVEATVEVTEDDGHGVLRRRQPLS